MYVMYVIYVIAVIAVAVASVVTLFSHSMALRQRHLDDEVERLLMNGDYIEALVMTVRRQSIIPLRVILDPNMINFRKNWIVSSKKLRQIAERSIVQLDDLSELTNKDISDIMDLWIEAEDIAERSLVCQLSPYEISRWDWVRRCWVPALMSLTAKLANREYSIRI